MRNKHLGDALFQCVVKYCTQSTTTTTNSCHCKYRWRCGMWQQAEQWSSLADELCCCMHACMHAATHARPLPRITNRSKHNHAKQATTVRWHSCHKERDWNLVWGGIVHFAGASLPGLPSSLSLASSLWTKEQGLFAACQAVTGECLC